MEALNLQHSRHRTIFLGWLCLRHLFCHNRNSSPPSSSSSLLALVLGISHVSTHTHTHTHTHRHATESNRRQRHTTTTIIPTRKLKMVKLALVAASLAASAQAFTVSRRIPSDTVDLYAVMCCNVSLNTLDDDGCSRSCGGSMVVMSNQETVNVPASDNASSCGCRRRHVSSLHQKDIISPVSLSLSLSLSVLIPSSYYQHCPFPLQLEHSVCITSHRSTLLAFAASRRPSACTESPVRFRSSRLSSPLTLESSELTARCSRMPVSTVSSSMSWTETSFPT